MPTAKIAIWIAKPRNAATHRQLEILRPAARNY
jgi:hypothetical protein